MASAGCTLLEVAPPGLLSARLVHVLSSAAMGSDGLGRLPLRAWAELCTTYARRSPYFAPGVEAAVVSWACQAWDALADLAEVLHGDRAALFRICVGFLSAAVHDRTGIDFPALPFIMYEAEEDTISLTCMIELLASGMPLVTRISALSRGATACISTPASSLPTATQGAHTVHRSMTPPRPGSSPRLGGSPHPSTSPRAASTSHTASPRPGSPRATSPRAASPRTASPSRTLPSAADVKARQVMVHGWLEEAAKVAAQMAAIPAVDAKPGRVSRTQYITWLGLAPLPGTAGAPDSTVSTPSGAAEVATGAASAGLPV